MFASKSQALYLWYEKVYGFGKFRHICHAEVAESWFAPHEIWKKG